MGANRIALSGRRAVITGGASGLGLATARRLLESGASVAVWDLAPDAAREELAGTAVSVHKTDVTDYTSVEAAVEESVAALGGIDILVNSAGTTVGHQPLHEYPHAAWHTELAVNLTGTFHVCQVVVPHMLAGGYGRIVNVASIAGKEGNRNQVGYVAAKAGVIGLTKALGRELAGTGIVANSITPTLFDTPLYRTWAADQGPEIVDAVKAQVPLGRVGRPEEAAAMIAWMASEDCSFTTGMTFDVTGGRASY